MSEIYDAFISAGLGDAIHMARHAVAAAASAYEAPSAIYRPKIFMDGDEWCALYGDDLQAGVSGFGKSPALAMSAFDKAWFEELVDKKSGGE